MVKESPFRSSQFLTLTSRTSDSVNCNKSIFETISFFRKERMNSREKFVSQLTLYPSLTLTTRCSLSLFVSLTTSPVLISSYSSWSIIPRESEWKKEGRNWQKFRVSDTWFRSLNAILSIGLMDLNLNERYFNCQGMESRGKREGRKQSLFPLPYQQQSESFYITIQTSSNWPENETKVDAWIPRRALKLLFQYILLQTLAYPLFSFLFSLSCININLSSSFDNYTWKYVI